MFNTFIYTPLYNGIVGLMSALPSFDLGVIVIIFTIIIRLILFPLSKKSVETQLGMKEIQPQLDEIKKKHKNDKQKQAELTMQLYKESGINPFSSIFLILLQLPIIFGLYFIFIRAGFPEIDASILYSFISSPENVNVLFLGIIDVTEKSIILAALAGITQFVQAKLATPPDVGSGKGFGAQFAKTMQLQMKYVFPIIIAFISYSLSATIAIYWTTSNLFTIGQELYLRRKFKGRREKTTDLNQ